jgi:formylglycine-generating enzyme required for sulfatase activity
MAQSRLIRLKIIAVQTKANPVDGAEMALFPGGEFSMGITGEQA